MFSFQNLFLIFDIRKKVFGGLFLIYFEFIFNQITGEGRKRSQISIGSYSEVSFPGKAPDADIRSFNASIQVRFR